MFQLPDSLKKAAPFLGIAAAAAAPFSLPAALGGLLGLKTLGNRRKKKEEEENEDQAALRMSQIRNQTMQALQGSAPGVNTPADAITGLNPAQLDPVAQALQAQGKGGNPLAEAQTFFASMKQLPASEQLARLQHMTADRYTQGGAAANADIRASIGQEQRASDLHGPSLAVKEFESSPEYMRWAAGMAERKQKVAEGTLAVQQSQERRAADAVRIAEEQRLEDIAREQVAMERAISEGRLDVARRYAKGEFKQLNKYTDRVSEMNLSRLRDARMAAEYMVTQDESLRNPIINAYRKWNPDHEGEVDIQAAAAFLGYEFVTDYESGRLTDLDLFTGKETRVGEHTSPERLVELFTQYEMSFETQNAMARLMERNVNNTLSNRGLDDEDVMSGLINLQTNGGQFTRKIHRAVRAKGLTADQVNEIADSSGSLEEMLRTIKDFDPADAAFQAPAPPPAPSVADAFARPAPAEFVGPPNPPQPQAPMGPPLPQSMGGGNPPPMPPPSLADAMQGGMPAPGPAPMPPPAPAGAPLMGGAPNMDQPRGIRNNNPGNIEFNAGNNWAGQSGTDGRFAMFDTPEDGVRAMFKTLQSYRRQGVNTLSEILNRWAPSSENDTASYIQQVARATGIAPNGKVDTADKLKALVEAMIYHENGINPYGSAIINRAYSMAQ